MRYTAVIDSLEIQMHEHIKKVLDNQEVLKAVCVVEREVTCQIGEPLPPYDRQNEESKILTELSGGIWDVLHPMQKVMNSDRM
jgi:hypothetical protein